MLLIDDTRASLPTPLTDAVSSRHAGLRRVRLLRTQGQAGAVHLERATWALETPMGEPPGFGESPDTTAEDIVATVHRRACEVFAEGGKEKRFKVELTVALEDGGEETTTVGFAIDEAAAASVMPGGGSGVDRSLGTALDSLTRYIERLHGQNIALMEGQNRGMRTIVGSLPTLIQLRMSSLEDRIEAMLERDGVEPPKSAGDDAWRAEAIKGLRELLVAVAPGIFPKGSSAPEGSLRAKLQALGNSLSDMQQLKLAGLLGAELATKLKDAGLAEDDKTAAVLLSEVIAAVDGEGLDALLEEGQRKQLAEIFDAYEKILNQGEKKPGA